MSENGKTHLRRALSGLDVGGLIAYFDSRKEFAGKGTGANQEDIERREKLAGFALPGEYRVFLERFGADTGPLFPAGAVSFGRDAAGNRTEHPYKLKYGFTLDDVLPYCRKGNRPRLFNQLDQKMLLIGIQRHSEDGGFFFLDTRKTECPFVNVDVYGELSEISPSFRDFLLDYAFLKKGRF